MQIAYLNELLFFLEIVFVVVVARIISNFEKGYLKAFVLLQGLLANLFVLKEISIFGLNVCSGDIFVVGILLSLNLLEYRFGKKHAQSAINTLIFSQLAFIVFVWFHLRFLPTNNDLFHFHYQKILEFSPRLVLAGLSISFLTLNLDRAMFRFFSRFELDFALKNIFASSISQFFDTLLFATFALPPVFSDMISLVLFSYLVKLACILLISTGFIGFGQGEDSVSK